LFVSSVISSQESWTWVLNFWVSGKRNIVCFLHIQLCICSSTLCMCACAVQLLPSCPAAGLYLQMT
jgi:hypothetical protein